MFGLAFVLLYVAYVSGFGNTNIGTSVHNGADFLFYWYICWNCFGMAIMSFIGFMCAGIAVLPETKQKDSTACGAGAIAMLFLTPWVMFKTFLLGAGTWLISLGVPVESNVEDWNWVKIGIGAALIFVTLVFLRGRETSTEKKDS